MEELATLKEYIEAENYQEALLLIDELEAMIDVAAIKEQALAQVLE